MSAYQTLVVGTDRSDSSLRAVDRAAAFAAENKAKLIVAMAHFLVWRREAGQNQPGRIG
jgi:nucleotide-binding universal stress UspA family protein